MKLSIEVRSYNKSEVTVEAVVVLIVLVKKKGKSEEDSDG